jgi:membrane fusion protein (multidrug efflux system)
MMNFLARLKLKKLLLVFSSIIIIAASLIYWINGRYYLSTDDAYVNANVVQVAARVTGQVQHLYVKNNQFVHEGELLFDLDPAPFVVIVEQNKAQLAADEAKLKLAQLIAKRTAQLLKSKVTSEQQADTAEAGKQAANAIADLDKANLSQAQLNLNYTKIQAPTNGWVTNVSLRIGDVVTANQPLFALISNDEFWIDANFKETELNAIHAGQKADVTVDIYPGHAFTGIVESISGGSGTAFSLLPPENATGNWVKVTQRVPVRIHILNPDSRYPLRIGTSATVRIHL